MRRDFRVGKDWTAIERGHDGWLLFHKDGLKVLASYGLGWDHVSVSRQDRTPTWGEMCTIKDLIFEPDECVIQYHPPRSRYINAHPFCLHMWRPQGEKIPMPPLALV